MTPAETRPTPSCSPGSAPGTRPRWKPLFVRYEGPVFRFLFGVLRDHHAAEDALQETFVQAIRYADAVDARTPSAGGCSRSPTGRRCS